MTLYADISLWYNLYPDFDWKYIYVSEEEYDEGVDQCYANSCGSAYVKAYPPRPCFIGPGNWSPILKTHSEIKVEISIDELLECIGNKHMPIAKG